MKTFTEFQEGVAALGLKSGSKLIPALMTGIGAAGTMMQIRKKEKENLVLERKNFLINHRQILIKKMM